MQTLCTRRSLRLSERLGTRLGAGQMSTGELSRPYSYGKGHLYCVRVLNYTVRTYTPDITWLLDSRKAWAENIANEWLLCRSIIHVQRQTVDYINIKSENQKSSLVILLVCSIAIEWLFCINHKKYLWQI